jgi:hypothetical protein
MKRRYALDYTLEKLGERQVEQPTLTPLEKEERELEKGLVIVFS